MLNVIRLEGAAQKPDGDVILCDVAREDASVIISDLKELGIHEDGSIAMEFVDTSISKAAEDAERAAAGLPTPWSGRRSSRTSENTELSVSFVMFMVLAMQIAAVGVVTDQPILIVGAMVVGPEFGPLAGLSVALVERRVELAKKSVLALAVGFPVGIVLALLTTLFLKAVDAFPETFTSDDHPLTRFLSNPDFLSFFVAVVAGIAEVLSLTNSKSGALIGVLISVTTIPAASAIGVEIAYGDVNEAGGAALQLGINLAAITLAGVVTLFVQRRWYVARRRKHLMDPARQAAGLPMGRSRGTVIPNLEELQKRQGG